MKSALTFYLQMVLTWILAVAFYFFIRNYGLVRAADDPIMSGLSFQQILLMIGLVGTVAGVFYGSVELLFDRPYFQRRSYIRIILGKLVFFFFAVKIMMVIAIFLTQAFSNSVMEPGEIIQILRSKIYWVIFIYFLLVAGIITFVRMVNQKFGPGILWNMFIGRYRNPREELRVFMFLDLRSSTTIAEKLGHIKFSRLIQDCFADLTPVIKKHGVEIYQYVGDEAVLCWPMENGLQNNHCIHCYFDFMDVLTAKADHYESNYGLQPFFKAGVHLGSVIVAEVGLIKREIAYHGDVLNTTARIQGMCNDLQQELLVSDQLMNQLQPDTLLQSIHMGEELLKGKQTAVSIHGLKRI